MEGASWEIEVEGGKVPVWASAEPGEWTVVLAHGAGSHAGHKTVLWLAERLIAAHAQVVRFDFLYRAEGKSLPDRMPKLAATYAAVVASVRQRLMPRTLVTAGHSMGGRVGTVLASEGGDADGVIAFSYPLHPPGKPDQLRDAHLPAIRVPVLQLSGTRDEFCEPERMRAVQPRLDPQTYRLHWLEGADHSYGVRRDSGRTRADLAAEIEQAIREWRRDALAG